MSSETINNNSSNLSDERYFPRWEAKKRVTYQLDGSCEVLEGFTKDLSCAGVCICVYRNIATQQHIILDIFLSDHRVVQAQGEILWTNLVDHQIQLGVNFSNITEAAQNQILNHAFELNKAKFVDNLLKGWNSKT